MKHTKDEDCTVNKHTNTCEVCGVYHGEICPFCCKHGFHEKNCPVYLKHIQIDKDFFKNLQDN